MIVTTQNQGPTFSAPCWITGAAGFTDAGDPNAFAPDPARIISPPAHLFGAHMGGAGLLVGGPLVSVFLADGTSATVRVWMYDDAAAIWAPLTGDLICTYATSNAQSGRFGVMPGARLFGQVTANTGATKIAFMIR